MLTAPTPRKTPNRRLIAVLVAIVIPGLFRALGSSAFEGTRLVDLVTLFLSGMATGVLATTVVASVRARV